MEYIAKTKTDEQTFDGKKLTELLIRDKGIRPVNPSNEDSDNGINLWSGQSLTEVTLPDGSQGKVYVDDEDYLGVFFIHDDDSDKKHQLMGFQQTDDGLMVTYALDADLWHIYWNSGPLSADKVIPGTVETVFVKRNYNGHDLWHMDGQVRNVDCSYMYNVIDACRKQGYTFNKITFHQIVPVPVCAVSQ